MAITSLRSFKVVDFCINWKPVCDFLLVIKINLRRISHHFQVIADYSSDLPFWWVRVHVFSTLTKGKPVNSGPQNLALRKLDASIALWYGVGILTDDYFILSQSTYLAHRRMDIQTEKLHQVHYYKATSIACANMHAKNKRLISHVHNVDLHRLSINYSQN